MKETVDIFEIAKDKLRAIRLVQVTAIAERETITPKMIAQLVEIQEAIDVIDAARDDR